MDMIESICTIFTLFPVKFKAALLFPSPPQPPLAAPPSAQSRNCRRPEGAEPFPPSRRCSHPGFRVLHLNSACPSRPLLPTLSLRPAIRHPTEEELAKNIWDKGTIIEKSNKLGQPDVASTEGANRLYCQPLLNALRVEVVIALRELDEHFLVLEVSQADRAYLIVLRLQRPPRLRPLRIRACRPGLLHTLRETLLPLVATRRSPLQYGLGRMLYLMQLILLHPLLLRDLGRPLRVAKLLPGLFGQLFKLLWSEPPAQVDKLQVPIHESCEHEKAEDEEDEKRENVGSHIEEKKGVKGPPASLT